MNNQKRARKNYKLLIGKYLFLILITISSQQTFSQSIGKIDSLNERATSFRNVHNDSLYTIALQSLDMSEKANYAEGKANAYANLCYSCYFKSNYDEAVRHCNNAIQLHQNELSDKEVLTTAYQFLGLTKINQGKFNDAITAFSELIKLATQLNNNFVLADACSNMGLAYLSNKDYSKAKQYYLKSLKIHDNIDYPDGKVYVFQNIGRIYFDQGDYNNARTFLHNAAVLAKEINNHRALFYAYTLLGQISDPFDNESEAILLRAVGLADSLALNFEKPEVKFFLAELYFKRKEYSKSEKHAEIAIQDAEKRDAPDLLLKLYNLLIRSYTLDEKYDEAERYAELYKVVSNKGTDGEETLLSSLLNLSEMASADQDYVVAKQGLVEARNLQYQRYIIIASVIITTVLLITIFLVIIRSNRKIGSLKNQLERQNKRHESDMKKAYSQLIKFKNDQLLNDIELSKEQQDQLYAIKKSASIDSKTFV